MIINMTYNYEIQMIMWIFAYAIMRHYLLHPEILSERQCGQTQGCLGLAT